MFRKYRKYREWWAGFAMVAIAVGFLLGMYKLLELTGWVAWAILMLSIITSFYFTLKSK